MTGAEPAVLVIGGHDSSGGAGVDVDREALRATEVRASVVVSAWTVQDEGILSEIEAVSPAIWLAEAVAAFEPGTRAVKFGLLPDQGAVAAARELVLAVASDVPAVFDPVIAASSGGRFLEHGAVAAYRELLLPLGAIWTPNLPELAELCGVDPDELATTPQARVEAAQVLLEAGARAVLVKGGHGHEDPLRDLVLQREIGPTWIERERHAGPGIRGTGCRFASALAGRLARGEGLVQAAQGAGEWVARCIRDCA